MVLIHEAGERFLVSTAQGRDDGSIFGRSLGMHSLHLAPRTGTLGRDSPHHTRKQTLSGHREPGAAGSARRTVNHTLTPRRPVTNRALPRPITGSRKWPKLKRR